MKNHFKFILFVSICTLWSGLFFILPDFIDNPYNGIKGFFITIFYWGVVCFASFFLMYLLAINKYIFSVLFPIYTFLGAVLGFYRHTFKASLTPMIIDATFNNDYGTTLDLISVELVLYVVLSLSIAVISIIYRFKKINFKAHFIHLILGVCGILLIFNVNNRIKTNVVQRFPYNIYYSLSEYLKLKESMSVERMDFEPDFECKSVTINNDS